MDNDSNMAAIVLVLRFLIRMKAAMKPILTIVSLSLGGFCCFTALAQDGVWSTSAPSISARALGAATTFGGKVYMVGGGNYSCGVTSALQAYDPVANAWTNLAGMPTARYEFGATELNGLLYAIAGNPGCGSAGSALRAVEAYDPVLNTWTSKAPLPTGGWDVGVAGVNGKVYAFGGFSSNVYAYDPASNTWATKSPLPQPYSSGAAVVFNGIVYLIGGNPGNRAVVQAYNPVSDTWAIKASMPTPRYYCAGAALNGLIYVAGGYTSTGAVATVEAYNPATDAWTAVAPLPFRLWTASAAAVNGKLLVMGGFDTGNATLGSVEVFTPNTAIVGIAMYAGLTVAGPPGSTNLIEYKTDLAATNWNALGTVVLPAGPSLFIDPNPANSVKRFYRAVRQ